MLRTAGIAAACGVTAVVAGYVSGHPKRLEADTAFVRHDDIRDIAASRYQLINQFWIPVQVGLPHHQIHPVPRNNPPLHFGAGPADGEFDVNDPLFECDFAPDLAVGALGTTSLFHHAYTRRIAVSEAIERCRRILERHREELGSPGLVVGVSVNGRVVWSEGLGCADHENQVNCRPETVMRIASIGKAVSMTIIAKLWQDGLLDLDKPIQEYVPDFPLKSFDGQPVTITCRQLVSHLSGIRHYSKTKKDYDAPSEPSVKEKDSSVASAPVVPSTTAKYNEFDEKEYYLRQPFPTVAESVKLFKDDPLLAKTGEEFLYTTHGWTLLCAVIEAVTKRKITECLRDLFRDLGMQQTFLDEHEPIVYNRSRNYRRDKTGKLKNAPYVDNSYKWAGGGLLSTVGDLLKFAHVLLRSYQVQRAENASGEPGYLKPETISSMWTLVDKTKKNEFADNGYGMGWMVAPEKTFGSWCYKQPHIAFHTGGAIGASSVLVIIPRKSASAKKGEREQDDAPQGIVVTIIANLEQAALYRKAVEVANIFDQVRV